MNLEEYEKLQPKFNIKINNYEYNFCTPNLKYERIYNNKINSKIYLLQWINRIDNGSILLDATAETGFHSILAAGQKKAKVYAFETNYNNYYILNENIKLNKLNHLITPFFLHLSDEKKFTHLNYKNEDMKVCNHGLMCYKIDDAINEGIIETPSYLKISNSHDIYKILNGAINLLESGKLKSISITINDNIKNYENIFDFLNKFNYFSNTDFYVTKENNDNILANKYELIFNKIGTLNINVLDAENKLIIPAIISNDHIAAQRHTINKIVNSNVITEPFPHLVIDNIFPQDYYDKMLSLFPSIQEATQIDLTNRVSKGAYKERKVTLFEMEYFDTFTSEQFIFWSSFSKWFYSDLFIQKTLEKFMPWCASRLNDINLKNNRILLGCDALFVHDQQNYELGPHTDAAHRLLTFLYYMPNDNLTSELGTSLYKAKNIDFICSGGPHYTFDDFQEIKRVEYLPNRLVSFVRTGRSFHGVPKILNNNIDRKLIINNVRLYDE